MRLLRNTDLWLIVGGLLVAIGCSMAWLPLGPIVAGAMIIRIVLSMDEPEPEPEPETAPGTEFDALMVKPPEA